MLLIQNGRVLDPYTQMDALCDVLIGDDGVIAQVAEHIDAPAGCTVYDASGLTVSPGFVDGHVHFRDPGQTQKEDVLTGAAAAAAGGYATVICMANTVPTCDTPEIIRYVTDKAKDCPVQVLQAGSVTKGLKGQELTDFDALLEAGAPCLTDDGINLTSAALCRTAMAEAAKRGTLLSFHEEEPSLVPSHGTYARMNPPLRKEADRQALIAALADGTIDMVATDHAPHTAEEKAREFAKAPSGITGLETAFSVCNTYLVQTGKLTPMQLVDRMSKAPAEIYGLTDRAVQAGNFARLVLLDWDTEKVYETYKSKGINTPYTGKKLTGSPKAIVTGAKVTE